eukprot:TRINITY_DN2205_c0_g1_i1.p1 TRINITY_DN2205_c0_g1~~TRINITY_DN2205_c0_g1_i1.p1  ORF type:complete len:374 (-),score=102.23 TRINITY_DN2205_c0_g1_i1:311-1432(-)
MSASPTITTSTTTSSTTTASTTNHELTPKEKLQDIMRLPGNDHCADCGDRNPDWASITLGVFLCITCAGIHRHLGSHISRVKSVVLDTWKMEEVDNMERGGNKKAKEQYEYEMRGNRPIRSTNSIGGGGGSGGSSIGSSGGSGVLMEQWIRAKYVRKLYTKDNTVGNTLQITKEGFLSKKGEINKSFRKRWFKLFGTMLFYYRKQKEQPTGCICLIGSKEPDCAPYEQDVPPFCLTIPTPNRTYYLAADTAEEMFDWCQALRSCRCYLLHPSDFGYKVKSYEIEPTRLSSFLPDLTALSMGKRKNATGGMSAYIYAGQILDYLIHELKLESRDDACLLFKQMVHDGLIISTASSSSPSSDHDSLDGDVVYLLT